jgi:hypothetical protein
MMRKSVEELKADIAEMSYVDKLHLKEYIDRSMGYCHLVTLTPEDFGRDEVELDVNTFFEDKEMEALFNYTWKQALEFAKGSKRV